MGNYYHQALQLQEANFQIKAELVPLTDALPQSSFLGGLGGKIFAEIKKIICPLLDGTSTEDQIIQAVLSALATIIPGGIFIEALASIIVKFLLSTGISNFAPHNRKRLNNYPTLYNAVSKLMGWLYNEI